jgi:myo-inositol-1(or 4)-monophosphatase
LSNREKDAFYEFGIHSWDIAAACCIIEEAGGICRDVSGKDLDLLARNVLAGAPLLVQQMAEVLQVPEVKVSI